MIVARDVVRATPLAEHGGRLGVPDALGIGSTELAGRRYADFSVCLNAYGPSPAVIDAIRSAAVDEYPDPQATSVRARFAACWSIPAASIMVGAGSAELIYATCFAYLRAGDVVMIAEPAFGEYRRAAVLCGARVAGVRVSENDDPFHELGHAIASSRPRLVFIASPANPTGRAFNLDALTSVADACSDVDALLVLDQAYDPFADRPLGTPALRDHPHVLHLRSLTKDNALAGIRVALAVGPSDVVADVEAARVPWATSSIAQAAAVASLHDSAVAHVTESIAALRAERARISDALRMFGVTMLPSATHYALIECTDATTTRDGLARDHDVLVRDCTSFGLPRRIRVAARLPEDNDRLIEALRRILSR